MLNRGMPFLDGMNHRETPSTHPLALFFHSKKFTINEGLNWLQANGHISDNCIELEDVAEVDWRRVLKLAGAEWAGK